jgi:hypothetical protein
MSTILSAPARLTAAQKKSLTTLFLAGPFEDDDGSPQRGRSWRDEVIDACADLDVTIIDPRSDRWPQLAAGSAGRRGAYEWQCAAAFEADVVVVWIPDGRHAPTALLILGYLGAKRSNPRSGSSVVVGGNGWGGLVKLFAQNQRLFVVGDELDQVIRVTRLRLSDALAAKGLLGNGLR